MSWEFLLYVHHRLLSSNSIHLKTELKVAKVLGNNDFEEVPALQEVSIVRGCGNIHHMTIDNSGVNHQRYNSLVEVNLVPKRPAESPTLETVVHIH